MSKQLNEKFMNQLPEKCQNIIKGKHIKFPEHIDFIYGPEIKIILPAEAVSANMQTDDAAFEGWTLTIHALLSDHGINKKIFLDINNGFEEKGKKSIGHYNRFLYRLYKFSTQFPFVKLSDKLSALVGKYYYPTTGTEYCNFKDSHLIINKPSKEAGYNNKPETMAEKSFSENPSMLIAETQKSSGVFLVDEVFRQLPVGMFKDRIARDTTVFTRGASAIDLWSISKDQKSLCVYELKVKGNIKVGIISELFFYANLMYDVFGPNANFLKCDQNGQNFRGFDKLAELKNPIEHVYAYFLVEELHPLITNKVISQLSGKHITYKIMKY